MSKPVVAKLLLALGAAVVLALTFGPSHSPLWSTKQLTLYGNVDIRQAALGFRVAGKLDQMYVEEGDAVSAGQVLAELDPAVYAAQLTQAEQRLLALQANLARLEAQAERREGLVEALSVSKEEFEALDYERKALEAQVHEAEARCIELRLRVDDTRLRASMAGIIQSRVQEPGAVLAAGQPVYTLTVPEPLWIRTYVSEPQLGLIKPGLSAKIETDSPGLPLFDGQIGFISPVAEFTPKSIETADLRTDLVYQVRVMVSGPAPQLRQGMPVTIHLAL